MAVRKDDLERTYLEYREFGQEELLEDVVRAGRTLVCYFARLYTGGTEDDVMQAGMEGLLKAVQRFDPDKGVTFITYAGHCIMGEIRHFLRKESSYYKPGCIADLQSRVDRFVEEILKERGTPPAMDEIAAGLNVKEEGIAEVMRAGLVSLDEVDVAKIKTLKYETFKLPIEDKLLVEQALKSLNELQKRVIYLLFYKDLTQTQAAKKLGISQRKVSRILHKSLQEMRNKLKN
ncbi:MAG: sigma-70 family RNA polymerase sigma factor [Bacillota bacterium]|nr:sigma-70 family RNA polymerase sigma factor [Bacillota bacterium]MDW7683209.1 sigma-70 family RNA polymerase sigma factor [Bacillota bacterium]